jgi:hypothetical protein
MIPTANFGEPRLIDCVSVRISDAEEKFLGETLAIGGI